MISVAVIGAGLSGLSCARTLRAGGARVVVFEKSRSLGGRCATRCWEGHVVDHGAQYFTMRDPAFRAEMERLIGPDLRRLEAPILDAAGAIHRPEEERWYHAAGNNRLGRALAEGLDLRMETTVTPPELHAGRWKVQGETFDFVVSSAPWPQTLALLGRPLVASSYAPCLTAFFAYADDRLPPAYARSAPGEELAWAACENHKPGRVQPGSLVFVAQASPAFSAAHLEADPTTWAALLQARLEADWRLDPAARGATFTHRWRYARRGEAIAPPDLPPGFFVSGDTTTESRVESAWLAGVRTAGEVIAAS